MKIFIATPFSSRVDADGKVNDDFKQLMLQLTQVIKDAGHEYFLALEHEGWQLAKTEDASVELGNDFKLIARYDLVVVYLEDRISAGTQLEVGYAYANDVSIHMFQSGGKAQWSNKALAGLPGNSMTMVDDDADFVKKASVFIRDL